MGIVNADAAELLQTWNNIKTAITSIETTRASMSRRYRDLGNSWKDKKYDELGDVLQECNRAFNEVLKTLTKGEKYLDALAKSLQEYESTNLNGGNLGRVLVQTKTEEDFANDWKNRMAEIEEMMDIYRQELIAHGVVDGALLTKFLGVQRCKMIQYEAEAQRVERRQRPPLSDDEVYHYVVVGDNSPYNYDYLVNQFGDFCLEEVNSWVCEINPNPNNDPRRTVNCGQCAAAVFRRLNGDTNAVAGLGTYSIAEMNHITGRTQTTMTPTEIEAYLVEHGAGAHVVVGVDRASGAGHWFNAFYDGRQVYTIEGQGGCLNGWPPDYGNVVHWDVSI